MSKPREFWIIDETPYSTWVSSKPLNSADTNEEIHVIEHSAYQSLKEENARLKEALDYIRSCHLTGQVVDGLEKIIGKNK